MIILDYYIILVIFTARSLIGFWFLDYVYFETSTSSPYQIRRIEELNKVRIKSKCIELSHFVEKYENENYFVFVYISYKFIFFI